jgi:hypothetical protein
MFYKSKLKRSKSIKKYSIKYIIAKFRCIEAV